MTDRLNNLMESLDKLGLGDAGEWSYRMRRSMQEIIPGLFLGPYSSAVRSSLPVLQQVGITHIICVRQDIEAGVIKPHFTNLFEYLVLEIADRKTENIMKFFPEANAFIEKCVSSGGRCLVHGNAGISRSATLVVAYIMQKFNLTFAATFSLVQQRRFCVGPNEGFMAQLAEFEPIYKAYNVSDVSRISRPKRKFEEVDCSISPTPFFDTGPADHIPGGGELCGRL